MIVHAEYSIWEHICQRSQPRLSLIILNSESLDGFIRLAEAPWMTVRKNSRGRLFFQRMKHEIQLYSVPVFRMIHQPCQTSGGFPERSQLHLLK